MNSFYLNRVKIYGGTEKEQIECFNTMFKYYKNYGKKLDLTRIMKQPLKHDNVSVWREKNWGCTTNALRQKLDADNTVYFETHDGYPLNVFKMLSVKHNTIQVSLLFWSYEDYIAHNYLLENGEIIKYNLISPDENETLYHQVSVYFTKNYLNHL